MGNFHMDMLRELDKRPVLYLLKITRFNKKKNLGKFGVTGGTGTTGIITRIKQPGAFIGLAVLRTARLK